MNRSLLWVGAVMATMALAACGGGGGNDAGNSGGGGTGGGTPNTFSIGGAVSGLPSGAQLSVLNSGSGAQTISANGPFTLTSTVAAGSSYSISVGTQPAGYQCSVSQGSGTMPASNVTNVAIACTTVITVGGSINGLTANGLVLVNNKDTLSVPANATTFSMPTQIPTGTQYNITVHTSPTGLHCTVSSGSGAGGTSPVTNVNISCAPATVSVLYSFGNSPDAQGPTAGVIQGSDGNFYGVTGYGGANNAGTVYKITPAGVETVLWSFGSGSDGSYPSASLVQGSDGNFYGTATSGGAYEHGAVFKITPSGSETVLWSFGASDSDGMLPATGLIQATDGNFYGATEYGGTSGYGNIFRITPSGTETEVVALAYAPDRNNYVTGLIQGSDGSLYGMMTADSSGGDGNGYGSTFKLTLDGTLTTLGQFDGTDGSLPVGKLVQASDGNFYGMTERGGSSGYGNIFKMTPSGTVSNVYAFVADIDGENPAGGLIQGSDGNLYGVTPYGGADGNGILFQVTLSDIKTTLYNFPAGTDPYSDGPVDAVFLGTDGGLYGVTSEGGTNGTGSVFQFN
jgi:uncharacterized repeat protein (TIGR03803 family)